MLHTSKNGGDIGTGKLSTKKRNNEIGRCEKLVKGLKDDVNAVFVQVPTAAILVRHFEK